MLFPRKISNIANVIDNIFHYMDSFIIACSIVIIALISTYIANIYNMDR